MKEDNYLDVSCPKCGHIPQSEKHLCEPVQDEWEAVVADYAEYLEDRSTGLGEDFRNDIITLLTSERARLRKEIKGMRDSGIDENTKMPHYLEFNKGVVTGWNDALDAVLETLTEKV